MLSDEEKKAIEFMKFYKEDCLKKELDNIENYETVNDEEFVFKNIQTVLNLIEKQSKEIEHQKEKRENQKKELAILNAKQIEFNKLVNTVNSYKGQFKRQQKEIEELKEENKTLKNLQNDTNRLYTEMIERNNYFERGLQKLEDKIKAMLENEIINYVDLNVLLKKMCNHF